MGLSISTYFQWKDALWLTQWNREATEADGLDNTIRMNLSILFEDMDMLREFFNRPIIVHVAYRPEAYNKLVKGASKSQHLQGLACDFHVQGLDCDVARKMIVDADLLELHGLRMEKLDGAPWIHIDVMPTLAPGKNRYFVP